MTERRADSAYPESDARETRPTISAWLFTVLIIAVLTLAGIGARYWVLGNFGIVHALLILFFSINLVICYWEMCLFLRRDLIERRADYWRARQLETGRPAAVEFLTTRVPLRRILSSMVWAEVWATYSQIDGSYADRRTYGFNVDIANGFLTPVPTLILYAAFTFELLPAVIVGIVGTMLFWQLTYATSVYWVSFFVANRQARLSAREMLIYIWALNSPWVLFALLGLWTSIRLTVDGDYGVLGY